jgi:hypothetical protein
MGVILEQQIVVQIIDYLPVLRNLVVHERHKKSFPPVFHILA